MFYSHEVLTSRKYGVATVWLVATLGSKSQSKKVNRKAIQEVDVPKACRTIVDPAAPMALRLQGNLLYGVSRVYLQQCGYVLSDAENAYNAMHMMLRTMKAAGLDAEAGKARPEQLVLQDDPSFLPEFALPPPELLAELDLGPALEGLRNGDSQSLTPFRSQQNPSTPEAPGGGLIFPSSSSVGPGEFWVQGDDGQGSAGGPSGMLGAEDLDEAIFDPGFAYDDDGNLVELTEANVFEGTPAVPGGSAMPSDGGASARVRQEHEDGLQAGVQQFGDQMDLDLSIIGDDLPEGEAFATGTPQEPGEPSEVAGSSATVAAPIKRTRTARALPIDTTMELRNKDLSDWNANYLANMKKAAKAKDYQRLAQLAKKRADYLVWGAGIGGIRARMPDVEGPTPFDQFIGDDFFELFTGLSRKGVAGTKHDRDSGIDEATQEESRRVRQRTDEPEEQMGRGDEDEPMFMLGGDEVEHPREAPSALDDQQVFSEMPWNISASIRGSSAVPRSGRVALMGSAGVPSSLTGPHARRGSRMVSASPLHGRGQPGGLEALKSFEEGDDGFGNLGADDFGFAGPDLSSDMPEPAFAQPNVRVREALSAEGENFLGFVADAIDEKRTHDQAELEPTADIGEVLFEELLPPPENSRMVAAQALMMTLTLGTKGLLNVRQDADFEEIGLSLTDKAKEVQRLVAAQENVEGDNREEEEEGQDEQEEGGHFEEQFAAGREKSDEGEEEDDGDSLYAD